MFLLHGESGFLALGAWIVATPSFSTSFVFVVSPIAPSLPTCPNPFSPRLPTHHPSCPNILLASLASLLGPTRLVAPQPLHPHTNVNNHLVFAFLSSTHHSCLRNAPASLSTIDITLNSLTLLPTPSSLVPMCFHISSLAPSLHFLSSSSPHIYSPSLHLARLVVGPPTCPHPLVVFLPCRLSPLLVGLRA